MKKLAASLFLALVVMGCSAESAPDGAAGSIKQAPLGDADIVKDGSGPTITKLPDGGGEVDDRKYPKPKKIPKCEEPPPSVICLQGCYLSRVCMKGAQQTSEQYTCKTTPECASGSGSGGEEGGTTAPSKDVETP